MDDAEAREHVAALSVSLETLPPAASETVRGLMGLYGELLRRVVAAAASSPQVVAALHKDELIGQMLLLHGVETAPSPVRETERCDLCAEELAEAHAHLLDTAEKTVLCACAVCALLFPQRADAVGRYRFIPEGAMAIDDFAFDALTWRALEIPVAVSYFVRRGGGGITAYYPSPAGAVESLLKLDAWEELERDNPPLRDLATETQALLVNGSGERTEGWIVGIDTCYRLISAMRANWRGLRGGEAARKALEAFFSELRSNSIPHATGENHVVTHAV